MCGLIRWLRDTMRGWLTSDFHLRGRPGLIIRVVLSFPKQNETQLEAIKERIREALAQVQAG